MKTHDARLVPAAVAAMTACHLVASGWASWRPVAAVALVTSVCAVVTVWGNRRNNAALYSAAIGFAVVGCAIAVLVAATGFRLDSRIAPMVVQAINAGEVIAIHGEVVAEARSTSADTFTGEPRWQATVLAASVNGLPAHARVRVVVADPTGLELGTRVRATGPGSTSRDAREGAILWDASVVATAKPDRVSAAISHAREGLREATAGLPEEVRALTEGMVIGDDSRMAPEQVDNMRGAGLAHLTAVSGAHFAVLTLLVVWGVRRAKAPRAWQAAVVGLVSGAFTLLVGPEPSVLRAVSMACAIALALAWGRPARAVPALSAGVLVILALDPLMSTSLGFQLSVIAVAAIAVWAPHLAATFARRLTPSLSRVLAIPVAAAAATAPLLVGVAGGFGTYNVPANLIAAPFVAPVTVFGLVGTALAPVNGHVASAFVVAAGAFAWPVAVAARAFSAAPGAWLEWPAETWAGPVAAAMVAVAVVATTARRVRGWFATVVVGLVLMGLAGPTALDAARAPRLPDWDVVVCDVGQGDMMLLRTAPHAAVVIDTGPRDGGATACLERHGVRQIDLLVLTHPHADHDGAVAHLLAAVPIRRAWLSPAGLDAESTYLLSSAGVPVEAVAAQRAEVIGDVRLQVVAPSATGAIGNDNDASVVVVADAGGSRVLALGDVESTGQAALARVLGQPVVVDLVKIAHHGSADQDANLANMITARVAAVSVGEGNGYGHPAASTIELYRPRVGALLRTDLCGDLLIASGPNVRIASRCPLHVAG